MGLAHLVLDERVPGLPHDWNSAGLLHGGWKGLRAFDVEDDRLPPARALEHVAGVKNQDSIAPHDSAILVHNADAVGVAVKRDSDLSLVLLHRRDEIDEVLRNGRIRVMVGKGSVALAKQTATFDAELCEQCRCDERSGSVSAVVHDANAALERANPLDDIVD